MRLAAYLNHSGRSPNTANITPQLSRCRLLSGPPGGGAPEQGTSGDYSVRQCLLCWRTELGFPSRRSSWEGMLLLMGLHPHFDRTFLDAKELGRLSPPCPPVLHEGYNVGTGPRPGYESFNLSTSFIFCFCSLSLSFSYFMTAEAFPILNLRVNVTVGAAGCSRWFFFFCDIFFSVPFLYM